MASKLNIQKKKIVHLGNVGEDSAYRSKQLAKRFSNFDFYGVDLKKITDSSLLHPNIRISETLRNLRDRRLLKPKPKNLEQIQKDFVQGLNRFKDGSLDLVSSDFGVGFYKKERNIGKLKSAIKKEMDIGVSAYIGADTYTRKVINLIYKKLKPNGKVIIYFFNTPRYRENLIFAFENSGFEYRIEPVDISKIQMNDSDKVSRYNSFYLLERKNYPEPIYRIIGVKK